MGRLPNSPLETLSGKIEQLSDYPFTTLSGRIE
jgi:hypothetical protein